jgi:hypothetical protein
MPDLSAQIVVRSTLSLCKKIQIYIFVGLSLENAEPKKFIALFRIYPTETTRYTCGRDPFKSITIQPRRILKIKTKERRFKFLLALRLCP